MHAITVGTTDGNTSAMQGLNPGDIVAVDNFDKLQDGMKVAVRQARVERQSEGRSVQSVQTLYPAAGGHVAVDGCDFARRICAFRQLPISALPEVDYPTIQVQTFYPGAGPDVMASAVTAPLERQFGQVPGLSQMTSTSSGGSSIITLQFSLDLSIDVAEQEVQAAINAAQTFLPADLPTPPVYNKTNPADTPILTLALTSITSRSSKVEDLADTRLAQKISQLPGVGLVNISGGQKPAVRIQANPTALSSYGLNLEDLRSALQATSIDQAKGQL